MMSYTIIIDSYFGRHHLHDISLLIYPKQL